MTARPDQDAPTLEELIEWLDTGYGDDDKRDAIIARLRAHAAALQADAQRYRHLRKKHAAPCDYDVAIDAAIAREPLP